MLNVTLFAESNLPIDLQSVVSHLNRLCKHTNFRKGRSEFQPAGPMIVHPGAYKDLDKAIRGETKDDLFALLLTGKPYDNNYFFEDRDNLIIVSFSGWDYLTSLPMNNGLVYFVADILSRKVDTSYYRHRQNTGCIYDFLWDKTGVDLGMRTSAICPKCLTRIGAQKLSQEQLGMFTDVRNVLNDLGSASKWGQDIVAYWLEHQDSSSDEVMLEGTASILRQNDFIPEADEKTYINVTRGHIGQLCERYAALTDADISSDKRGDVFEAFSTSFFGLIKGWRMIDHNARLNDCEIDIIYDITQGPDVLKARMGEHIYVECKNRRGKANVRDVSHFVSNLMSRNLKAGVFFSYNGISGYRPENWRKSNAAYQRIIDVHRQNGMLVIPMVAEDIEVIRNGKNLVDHLVDLLDRFVLV